MSSSPRPTRSTPNLVYVHGAGAQPPEADWIRIHNQGLFPDRTAPPTDLAYYADLLALFEASKTAAQAGVLIGPFEGPTEITAAAEIPTIPLDSEQTLAGLLHGSVAGAGRTHEAHLFLLRLAAAMGPTEHRIRSALPDDVIPPAVRDFYREVSGYLHGTPGLADLMRARVRDVLLAHDDPIVLLAHSLGSIIAFDVLGEPAFAGRAINFLSVGCPLGLGPTQDHLRAWTGVRPIEIPAAIKSWRNFAAIGDPVAHGTGLLDLRADYAPSLKVHSTEVHNEAGLHHALAGYLEAPEVRDTIYARLWERPERHRARSIPRDLSARAELIDEGRLAT